MWNYSYTWLMSKSPDVRMVKVNSSKVFYRFVCTHCPQGMFKMLSNLLCKVSVPNHFFPFNWFTVALIVFPLTAFLFGMQLLLLYRKENASQRQTGQSSVSAKGTSTYQISVTGDKAPNAAPETMYIVFDQHALISWSQSHVTMRYWS